MAKGLRVINMSAWYGNNLVLRGISVTVEPGAVTAIIGPSGCGKSTFIRCLNRLHEVVPGAKVRGRVLLDGQDIYHPEVDPVKIRCTIGMVFQKPNPFPTMSIFGNVAAGVRLGVTRVPREELTKRVELSLRSAGLWDEVSHRLQSPATSLSGGQQQRLCIARALAVEPEVLLLDEPCSALDPISTLKIEDLIVSLRGKYTIVIVTHNMQQAARVSDFTAFMLNGELIEYGPTSQVFTQPKQKKTEDYITGRFG